MLRIHGKSGIQVMLMNNLKMVPPVLHNPYLHNPRLLHNPNLLRKHSLLHNPNLLHQHRMRNHSMAVRCMTTVVATGGFRSDGRFGGGS
ncbi:hypothetical protein SESBI_11878 [Sesbania bispinosa]|nr:hypothetical protein SESBI_11878 [Sesbania bispinosa]